MLKLTEIPVSLVAKSADELSGLMLQNNMKYGIHFKYFDITYDGQQWVVWYYADVTDQVDKVIQGKLNGRRS